MNIHNIKILSQMMIDKDVLKLFYDIYKINKKDPDYNAINSLKALFIMLKDEKIVKHNDKYILTSFMPPIPSKAFLTNVLAVKNKNTPFKDKIYSNRTAPVSFYLALTSKCNQRCIYCSQKGVEGKKELTTDDWIKIIKTLQNMNTSIIGFTGGEPMMRDDICEIISAVDDRSITYLFTTGYNLNKKKMQQLKNAGLFGVSISLDSHIKEIHNKNRGIEDAFETAVNGIKLSAETGFYTMAQIVVTKEMLNKKMLFEYFEFAKKIGVDEIKLLEPIRSGNLIINNNEEIFITKKNKEFLHKIQKEANKISHFPKITTFSHTESKERYGCGAGSQHSYINCYGDLYPCDFVPLSFGNVLTENVDVLWNAMNKAIGKPKTECFGQCVNKEIQKNKLSLPLSKEESFKIAENRQSKEYPKIYKVLQGNKKNM